MKLEDVCAGREKVEVGQGGLAAAEGFFEGNALLAGDGDIACLRSL